MILNDDAKQLLREAIAGHTHRIWTKWLKYMFSKGVFQEDGSWKLPQEYTDRWTKQMQTKYKGLPEGEKKNDRRIADQYLTIFWLFQQRNNDN